MLHHRRFGLMALAFWWIPGVTEGSFGPGEAARHSVSRGTGQRVAQNADFRVLVWYRTSDPLGTFQDQIYDLRKGEYTSKVDEWIKEVKTKHPGYYVVVRDVDLKREKGETELLKVGSRHLSRVAGRRRSRRDRDRVTTPRLDKLSLRTGAGPQNARFQTNSGSQPVAWLARPRSKLSHARLLDVPGSSADPKSSSMKVSVRGAPPPACGSLLHAFGFGGVVSLAAVMTGAGAVLAVGGLAAPFP